VAVKVGGMYVGGRSRDDNAVCQELRDLVGPVDFDDYVVDLCFMTYTAGGLGSEYAAEVGVSPGMVGRKQRRFIVNVEVPPTLPDRAAYRSWMAQTLREVAELVRAYLPTKSKTYPAARLASEVEDLNARWDVYRQAL
jgi:hypothetical protein